MGRDPTMTLSHAIGGRLYNSPAAASNPAPARSTVTSSKGFPLIIMPIGIPSSVNPQFRLKDGSPVVAKTPVKTPSCFVSFAAGLAKTHDLF